MFKFIVALCLVGVSSAAFGFPGGWKNVESNSAAVTELVNLAVEHHNGEIDGLYYRGVVEVKSAKQQVVRGIKTEVTVVFGETHCAKADAGAKLCEIPANAFKEECVYTFWKEPAAQTASVLSSACVDL
ncbi:cystatin-like [Panonychus citri]|uniref:cystatin-like n=1 Tax=Panonychus citri TaxID=50023 RepID=UPI002306EE85|nr:cystatin-like [Panonychus citri]